MRSHQVGNSDVLGDAWVVRVLNGLGWVDGIIKLDAWFVATRGINDSFITVERHKEVLSESVHINRRWGSNLFDQGRKHFYI